jgi:hypothetical protein
LFKAPTINLRRSTLMDLARVYLPLVSYAVFLWEMLLHRISLGLRRVKYRIS